MSLIVRQIAVPGRRELLRLLERPGAAMLEGWSDRGTATFVLPFPEEVRTLEWARLGDADRFLAPILSSADRADVEIDLPFAGGWVGFIAYEVGAAWENAPARADAPDEPAAWFARHESGIVVLPGGEAFAFGTEGRVDELSALLSSNAVKRSEHGFPIERCEVRDSMGGGAYQAGVDDIRERISWGNVYQVNLTRRFTASAAPDPVDLYLDMTADAPPRCSAFLRGDGWSIASASPEVFLQFDPIRGRADARPSKGTLRRTGDDEADVATLLASRKDEAEHLMIVDLVRNDLGKVAPPGNVRVAEYRAVRTLAHVLHLESIVEANGLSTDDLPRLVKALFPGGSITGAPKRAAVHAIREIEPCARGVYTGAIGFIDRRGGCELSVAIRTAVVTEAGCRYHAGGGIVWDSDPEDEDRESFAKSIGFLRAIGEDA